ncbi:MAG: hypothetical protein U0930_20735 [Pirellulales bacterium]
MSILFRCPHCERQLQAPDNAVGKTAKCQACQGTCKVPGISQSSQKSEKPSTTASSASASGETIALVCSSCTKRLKAPVTSRGKKVRCTCGTVLLVPGNTAETPRQPSSSWLDGLPQESQTNYASNSSPFSFDSGPSHYPSANVPPSANSHYSPSPSSGADPYGQTNTQSSYSAQSTANMYLANAASEVSQERYVERGETWNVDWAKIGGGLLTMLGATVWFVVGLAANRIFYYPPVLFIIGLVAVLKGFFDGE